MIDLTRTNEEKSDGDTWNINGCGKIHINWEFPRNQPCFLGFVPLTAIAIDYLYWLSQKYRLTKCGMTWIHAPWHLAAQLSNVERSTLANPTMNHPSIQVKQPQWGSFSNHTKQHVYNGNSLFLDLPHQNNAWDQHHFQQYPWLPPKG